MFQWDHFQVGGLSSSERFLTTYNRDFRSNTDHKTWIRHLKAGWEADLNSSLQVRCETWPVYFQHFYKLTDDSQLQLPPLGWSAPSFFRVDGGVGSIPEDTLTQEMRVARDTGLSSREEDEVNVLKQLESKEKDEPHLAGVQYQEGVILLSPFGGRSCEDLLRFLCKETEPHQLLCPCVPQSHNKDPENLEILSWSLSPLSASLPPSCHCSYCAQKTELPVHLQQRNSCRDPSCRPPLTEYQAKFTAQVKTRGQQSFDDVIFTSF